MTYRIVLIHHIGEETITGTVYTNGVVFIHAAPQLLAAAPQALSSSTRFPSIASLTTVFGDSRLAHGTVDNLAFASPLPVDSISTPAPGEVQFASDTNWLYMLEQSA